MTFFCCLINNFKKIYFILKIIIDKQKYSIKFKTRSDTLVDNIVIIIFEI